jgi:signal transduction histidine kinase
VAVATGCAAKKYQMRSIERRALAAVVAAVLVGLTAMTIVATSSIEAAIEREFDGLLKDIATNIANSSDFTATGEFVITRVPDQAEFDRQRSGWYWMVTEGDDVISRSRSLWTERLKLNDQQSIADAIGPDGELLRVNILPTQAGQPPHSIKVVVSAPAANVRSDIRNAVFRLALILSAVGALTIASVTIVLRHALAPLSRSALDVDQLTKGSIERLPAMGYREIDPLVKAVNELMTSTRGMVEQSRLGSANLAHALRTPLAALRTRLTLNEQPDTAVLDDVARIERQIDYQLRRVRRVVGAPIASSRIPVRAVADDVALVVRKSHPDRPVEIHIDVADGAMFRGEREDLEELLSNLIDNSMKWAMSRVELNVAQHDKELVIVVQDDGPGIALDQRGLVVQPGKRLDEGSPGAGLGLFIANEIVEVYAGTIEFGRSTLGGLSVRVEMSPPGETS